MKLFCKNDDVILEPFSGSNNIVKLVSDLGYSNMWSCYDIDPPEINSVPKFAIKKRDTIKDFPTGYNICITNCPYLGKSSARRLGINYEWEEDDLYKVCLKVMLKNCKYVAVIIPESFITSNEYTDRLFAVVKLECKMFDDTDCPVCLALFSDTVVKDTLVYSNNDFLGTLQQFKKCEDDLCKYDHHCNLVFNDCRGSVGIISVDGVGESDRCRFVLASDLSDKDIKKSCRSYTIVYGIPNTVDINRFVFLCNEELNKLRENTKDTILTAFKGLRKDNKYRRRLDFKLIRLIMNKVFCDMSDIKIDEKQNLF